MARGEYGIAQAAFFTHFGKQSRTHPVTQNTHRTASLKVFGMRIRNTWIRYTDMRLARFMGDMEIAAGRLDFHNRRQCTTRPIAKQRFHLIPNTWPIDLAGDADNRL